MQQIIFNRISEYEESLLPDFLMILNNQQIIIKRNMLSFSHDQVLFEFSEKKHLETHIQITNRSSLLVCFKFRVNRPKYYLVKPDRGHLQPNETKRIAITLHKDGVSQSFEDRFKCYFVFLSDGVKIENYSGIEERSDVSFQKLSVKISKLPLGMQMTKTANLKIGDPMNSELKSLGNDNSTNFKQENPSASTYQGAVHEKEKKRAALKTQIEEINKALKAKRRRQKLETPKSSGNSIITLVGIGILGLGLGVLSSLWL